MMLTTLPALTMCTREIADCTNKEHPNVLRDARAMLNELGEDVLKFEGIYLDAYDREQPCLNLPKDLTITLVAGYNVQVRHAIVKRWQELEAQLAPAIPQTMAQALRLAAEQAEQMEQQQAALALAAPKVEFVDRYVLADGAKGFREVAKLLKVNEAEFSQFLQDHKVMYRLAGRMTPYQCHIDAGRFVVRAGVSAHNAHAFTAVKFTPKGIQWMAGELAKHKLALESSAA
jgi:phage antirepressor YoqD-like protein